VKTASDIYAPVSGEVVAVNADLAGHPDLVNSSPYAGGWFFKIQLSQPADVDGLLTPESYTRQIAP
jgi:glycine cleavage system H protein